MLSIEGTQVSFKQSFKIKRKHHQFLQKKKSLNLICVLSDSFSSRNDQFENEVDLLFFCPLVCMFRLVFFMLNAPKLRCFVVRICPFRIFKYF